MPRRLSSHHHVDPFAGRTELLENSEAVELLLGSVKVRATPVPLFRRGSGDTLEQAIRLHTIAPDDATVEVSVASGETTLDRTTATGPDIVHVFVPEVSSATTFRLSAASGAERAIAEIAVEPQRKWSIHLIHHSHFDIGYTDIQPTVLEHQLRYLDAVLDLIAESDDWPEDAKFRWNVEVTYPLREWLQNRPKAAREEFFRRVKEGRIEIHALPFSMHTEAYSIDELAWGLNFADRLRDEAGIEIVSAIQSDVPGAAIGLLNLLTTSGIRYFNVAHNYAGRSIPFRLDGQKLTRPFYWQSANGKRLLVWHTDTPHGVAYMDGALLRLNQSEELARKSLPDYLLALATRPYPYGKSAFGWNGFPADLPLTKQTYPHDVLHFRIQNALADNSAPSLTIAETVRDWNESWAFPKIRLSTNRAFFTEIEAKAGDKLDTFTGDWTDWWADGIGSGARPLGLNRIAQGTIKTARTLHALADLITDDRSATAEQEIDRTYEELALFDEHTWGSANPWEDELEKQNSGALQWARKSGFAYRASDRADVLLNAGLNRFAGALTPQADAIATVVVFNPSAWERTDLARVFLPNERVPRDQSFSVIEVASGRVVSYTAEPQPHPNYRAKGQWLTIAATVPPVGYATYAIVPGEAPASQSFLGDPYTLETAHYRVTVDPREGFIASIADLDSGRELVDADAPLGFNEYIYDRYTSGTKVNHLSGRIEAVDDALLGSRSTAKFASVVARTSDPIAERLTLRLDAEGTNGLETTISLPRDVKRIDLANRLFKIATLDKESVYFAFPFAVDDPDPEYEITGDVTSRDAPHVPGSVRHMVAIRHWAALKDGKGSVAWGTLEAPLIQIGEIVLPYAPFPSSLPADRVKPSTIYSWALNNIWDTNFPVEQGGEMLFRYAVKSDAEPGVARRLGMDTGASLSQPLAGFCLGRLDTGSLPASGTFVEVLNGLVDVVAIAPSRRGNALTIYLHSLAPEAIDATLRFPLLEVQRAYIGTHLERSLAELPLSNGTVSVPLAPGAFVALNLDL
jgi:hypothetical protein